MKWGRSGDWKIAGTRRLESLRHGAQTSCLPVLGTFLSPTHESIASPTLNHTPLPFPFSALHRAQHRRRKKPSHLLCGLFQFKFSGRRPMSMASLLSFNIKPSRLHELEGENYADSFEP